MEEIEIKFYRTVSKYHNGMSHSVHSWSNAFDNSIVKPGQDFWSGDKKYKGSGLGHGLRQSIADKIHPSNKASSVAEVGLLSQLQFSEVEIVGQALEKIKKDPEIVRYDNIFFDKVKKDIRYRKIAFNFTKTENIEFGGKRAQGNMMSQMKDPFNSKYRATWMVAVDELTWLIRHAPVNYQVIVDIRGNIKINHTLKDKFDLRSGGGHTVAYNKVTDVLGPMYHDFVGGNDLLKLKATWTTKK